jgi:hypothetical protein
VPFGAMLPDFSSMCRARVTGTHDDDVASGIELHHATDAAFHQLPAVIGLMRELDERLDRGGCARGPRRAVAHIGVELLLDGILIDEATYREAYLLGLEYEAILLWRDDGDAERFAGLIARLRSYGVPEDLRRPEAIGFRLARMLANRPLLAPSSSDLSVINMALLEHKPRVEVAADTVIRALRAALETAGDS